MRTALAVIALLLLASAAVGQTMSVDPAHPIVIEAPLNADPPTTFVVNITADRTTNWIVTGLPKWLKADITFGRTPATVTFTVTPPSKVVGASFGTTLLFTNLRTRLGDTARAVAVEVAAEEPKPAEGATWRLDGEVTPGAFTEVGASLRFSYTATNTGDTPIAGATLLPSSDADCPTADLQPGEKLSCVFDHVVTQDDVAAGRMLDTIELRAIDEPPPMLHMPLVAVYVPPLMSENWAWRIENITPTPTSFITIGEQVDFSFKLTNVSQQPLTEYSLLAGPMGWICYAVPVMEVGESAICSGSHIIDEADLAAGVFRFGVYVHSAVVDAWLNDVVAAYTPPYVLLCGEGLCLDDKGGRLVTP